MPLLRNLSAFANYCTPLRRYSRCRPRYSQAGYLAQAGLSPSPEALIFLPMAAREACFSAATLAPVFLRDELVPVHCDRSWAQHCAHPLIMAFALRTLSREWRLSADN